MGDRFAAVEEKRDAVTDERAPQRSVIIVELANKDTDVAIPAAGANVAKDLARGEDGFGFGVFARYDSDRVWRRWSAVVLGRRGLSSFVRCRYFGHCCGRGRPHSDAFRRRRFVPMFLQILQSGGSLEAAFGVTIQHSDRELNAREGIESFATGRIAVFEDRPGGKP